MLNQLPKPTIEKGIPIPPARHGAGPTRSSLFWEMEVGDSAFFAGDRQRAISAHARTVAQRSNGERTFTTRLVIENGVKGVRIWRIA